MSSNCGGAQARLESGSISNPVVENIRGDSPGIETVLRRFVATVTSAQSTEV
jgi:hypothetical protein